MSAFPPISIEFVRPCAIEGDLYRVGQVAVIDYDLARALMNAGFAIPEGSVVVPPPPRNWVRH